MPAAHCCWRATARGMLRVLGLLGTDGVYRQRAVLPAGWVREMARASRVNAETGLQVLRFSIRGDDALGVNDDNGSAFWVIPRRELAILNIANPGGSSPADLPEWLLKGIEPPAARR
jgi:CubicO group peptidase (beta-lactamase class C family)